MKIYINSARENWVVDRFIKDRTPTIKNKPKICILEKNNIAYRSLDMGKNPKKSP